MSRKLTALPLAMLVLAGAMSLKTVVAAHSNGAVLMANGGGIVPPDRMNGGGIVPPDRMNGGGIVPPDRMNGGGIVPPDRMNGGGIVPPDRAR
jgi:hypothetical protein